MMSSRSIRQKSTQKSHRYHDGSGHEKLMRHSNEKDRGKRDEASKHYKGDTNYRYSYARHKTNKRHRSDTNYRYSYARHAVEKNFKSRTTDLKDNRNDEKHFGDREKFVDCRPTSLTEEIKSMMQYEDHHIIFSKETTVVEWCPKYVKPDLKGHVRGGKALLHHTCRYCQRLCLHLLGRPRTPTRYCLECSRRWKKEYIPEWYYHYGCKYCSKK